MKTLIQDLLAYSRVRKAPRTTQDVNLGDLTREITADLGVQIRASGAQAVVTGNWGNDLTLLVKATRDLGLNLKFYTFYGNALGVPAALSDAGVRLMPSHVMSLGLSQERGFTYMRP